MGGRNMECRHDATWLRYLVVCVLATAMCIRGAAAQLSENFYSDSCPNVEQIVADAVAAEFPQASQRAGSGVLRLFFHDAFVNGPDASVLLSSTEGNTAERDAEPNLTLAPEAFEMVAKAKSAVEGQCKGVVSCADILAIATRDAVVTVGGSSYPVLKGRRDSRVSLAADVVANLPNASDDASKLLALFASKGLDATDLVALSGAHTIGFSNCNEFTSRLYPSTDPSLDAGFAGALESSCPAPGAVGIVAFDSFSPFVFDNAYYIDLLGGKGLLTSDAALVADGRTRPLVAAFAQQPTQFAAAFAAAMTKLGGNGALTVTQGEIRLAADCASIN